MKKINNYAQELNLLNLIRSNSLSPEFILFIETLCDRYRGVELLSEEHEPVISEIHRALKSCSGKQPIIWLARAISQSQFFTFSYRFELNSLWDFRVEGFISYCSRNNCLPENITRWESSNSSISATQLMEWMYELNTKNEPSK